MAARGQIPLDDSGQSILEFVLMLPVLLGLTMLMLRINTAIQMSIVNQQYARAQALTLTYNSPVYPEVQLREGSVTSRGYNSITLGVSENEAPTASTYVPHSSEERITRSPSGAAPPPVQQEVTQTAFVRIHDTVTLCTQPVVINVSGKYAPILPLGGGPLYAAAGTYNIPANGVYDYCRGVNP